NRILIRQIRRNERLADDRDWRRCRRIAWSHTSAQQQGNAQRFEKAWPNFHAIQIHFLSCRRRVSFNGETERRTVAALRRVSCDAGRYYAGKGVQAFVQTLIQRV